ncbi:hypothetical protein [Myxosarcina sp. GI1]|uniref:PFE-CTERM domain-containing protein n=1 Tax=Myxosarcina sp. GI1 TaxID=1541065 RepID=UPI00056BF976|nr:hypothetical protein [Myxosarcina sp. GI1]
MFLFFSPKFKLRLICLTGFLALGNLVAVDSATAFSVNLTNGDFETNDLSGWTPIGDSTVTGTIDGIEPINGSSHAITTTGHTTRIDDVDSSDPPISLDFNQSGSDPVNADINPNDSSSLQNQTSLSPEALSIDRTASNPDLVGDSRTSKEGSGFYQDFNVTISSQDVTNGNNGFIVSFNTAYLTNDGVNTDPGLGNQDYSYFSLLEDPESSTTNEISLLFESDDLIQQPIASDDFVYEDTTYYDSNNPDNQYTETVTDLAEGNYTYRAAFGVVDVDSYDRTSALMVDNFTVQQVPFEFSPTLGLLIVGGIFGGDRLRRHLKTKSSLEKLDL